jgi:hypothetical protein
MENLFDYLADNKAEISSVCVARVESNGDKTRLPRFNGENEDQFLEAYGSGTYNVMIYRKGGGVMRTFAGESFQGTRGAKSQSDLSDRLDRMEETLSALAGVTSELARREVHTPQAKSLTDHLEELTNHFESVNKCKHALASAEIKERDELKDRCKELEEECRSLREEKGELERETKPSPVSNALETLTTKALNEFGDNAIKAGSDLVRDGMFKNKGALRSLEAAG